MPFLFSESGLKSRARAIGRPFVALLLVAMVIGTGAAFYLATGARLAKAGPSQPGPRKIVSTVSVPLFFEPNLGQTDPQVKFLARGSGYGLFLTANAAVLELQPSGHQPSASSVIRMKLEGANDSARVSGASPLPGKSNYFIGNDPSKWRHGIPQFARVEYQAVYPGVDLVYYGDQGQLEYDFRVAPAADPNQIALQFDGASAHLDSGDLLLSTDQGDVRFHAPRIYQQDGNAQRAISGSFRQIADNKIGFTVGAYDRNRELVIDPVLSYSTYIGGSLDESLVHVAIGQDGNIYLAGSTLSSDFPTVNPFQGGLGAAGAQNIFIAVLNPNLQGTSQLVYATYLGGSLPVNEVDSAAGVAVSSNTDNGQGYDVYVAGSTTSTDFPTNGANGPFQATIPSTAPAGNHGFVTRLNWATNSLRYSTYLAGTNGKDTVTGLAIDTVGNAYVTGFTTSTNDVSNGFPANSNGFQTVSNAPSQFFASKINTKGTGTLSMLYSTYFGGGNPQSGTTQGGGIAVDASGNMYITGGTNFLGPPTGPNGEAPFPILNAQQSCLDEASTTVCHLTNPTALDAFVAKINPNIAGVGSLVYSTYLGGAGNDIGYGVAVDPAGSAYLTGSTTSAGATGWVAPTAITPFQSDNGGGVDAFIAKIGNPGSGTSFPLTYFTYLGGSGTDIGQAIVVDANQAAHVAGTTNSADLNFLNQLQGYGGSNDAMVALISTTLSGRPTTNNGDYLTWLGGSGDDQGFGIALDSSNVTYVSGITNSATDFPTTPNPYQSQLNGSHYDAFVSKLGANSVLLLSPAANSPSPKTVAVGNQVAFTFDILNQGPDTATNVIFIATIPATGVGSQAAKVTSGSGSCGTLVPGGTTITCTISQLAPGATGKVEVDLTPTVPVINPSITVKGVVSANGGPVQSSVTQPSASITDFKISATAPATITAGETTSTTVTLTPLPTYTASISVTDSGLPTGATGTFNPISPINMSGTTSMTTTLSIVTTARPVTTGSLLRGRSFYATWLPVGGLSLLGLSVGAGSKRRRWLAGALLGLIAGLILLQGACGSSSSPTTSGGTPAGTYTITITGSSGTISRNTTVQLIVN
ncbi:MAG: SBBP repeat-containing protein [Acidobacteriia bacterium]|nr:SBBP repeat-containing protein [Terriglobia bacterium]